MKTLNDFEKIAKKSKRNKLIKTVIISTAVSLLSLGLIYKGLAEVTSKNSEKLMDHQVVMEAIAYPNIDYSSAYYIPSSLFSGTFHSDGYKDIDGINVNYENADAAYSLALINNYGNSGLQISKDGKSAYTRTDLFKTPMFYNINHKYTDDDITTVTQDIPLLSQMAGQAVEVAVTFDKAYTYDEISKLIPNNLKINWYWIGSSSNYDTATLYTDAQLGFTVEEGSDLSADEIDKIHKDVAAALAKDPQADTSKYYPVINKADEKTAFANSYTYFQKYANQALKENWVSETFSSGSNDEMNLTEELESYLKNNASGETAKFSGLILTGRAENFAQLDDADWIFASNIGQTVTIQPYHTLDK